MYSVTLKVALKSTCASIYSSQGNISPRSTGTSERPKFSLWASSDELTSDRVWTFHDMTHGPVNQILLFSFGSPLSSCRFMFSFLSKMQPGRRRRPRWNWLPAEKRGLTHSLSAASLRRRHHIESYKSLRSGQEPLVGPMGRSEFTFSPFGNPKRFRKRFQLNKNVPTNLIRRWPTSSSDRGMLKLAATFSADEWIF